jgi:hypothetical protein
MRLTALVLLCIGFAAGEGLAADPPKAEIKNQHIRAKLYLPDAKDGFYRGTRFDWSGVIYSLEYQQFLRAVVHGTIPHRDFIYKDADIIAGRQRYRAGGRVPNRRRHREAARRSSRSA